ncbi:hypothetical protein OGV35_10385 [Citrobacter sp. Cb016]|uniref:hypothetical protein n=1 Tax=Citrobacter TaxID=544 RepID=UPI00257AA472|nr:hypothetical protein [Citrobacter sp. Cb016]MDM3398158.1 hypothetical protein [Citrobacter sp. Cb016]
MSKNSSIYINPSIQGALIEALPILASCLDDETKLRIKAAVESKEQLLQDVDNPLVKESLESLRLLLNVK